MILADINADAEQTTTMKDDSQEMTTADDAPLTMTSQIDVDLLLDDVTTSSGTYTSSSTKSGKFCVTVDALCAKFNRMTSPRALQNVINIRDMMISFPYRR